MAKILIVDDDVAFSTEVARLLQSASNTVEICNCGEDALQLLENFGFDLIVLDNNMPGLTGLEVCRKFRNVGGATPIIFLSGQGESETKSAGLDLGADDYVVKPFEPNEFLARVRAVLRRGLREPILTLSAANIELDLGKRSACNRQTTIQLTQTETNILEFFFRNKGRFFSSQELFQNIWPSDSDADEGAVRVAIHGLRRKFESHGLALPVRTQKGIGYTVDADQ